MNLTVAMKIIGGFTIISVFLIATSIISLNNLDTIKTSTTDQNKVAIPTLKGSNKLANNLSKMGSSTLKAYYILDLDELSTEFTKLKNIEEHFSQELSQLKVVVESEQVLMKNVENIETIYNTLTENVNDVFANKKTTIELKASLIDKINDLEEEADNTVTLLLDLIYDNEDQDFSDIVKSSERIETLFNAIISSNFEYRDLKDIASVNIVETEINNNLDEVTKTVQLVSEKLAGMGLNETAESLASALTKIKTHLTDPQGIFTNKKSQLNAIEKTSTSLLSAEKNITTANEILATQMELADKTTIQASQAVEDAVSDGNTQTMIIMAISIISAFVIAWATLISITRPLGRVNEMLNVVSSGDLSRKLDESGHDEFALLAKNCNLLIDSLRTLIQGIVSRSTQLATAAEQTSTVTAQGSAAIEEQRAQVEQAASATTEMSSTAQSVLTSANDALNEIKQADDEAERVKVISERNRNTIEMLASEVDDASQVINQLQQDSASIGGILDVIRGIADQTNLLALNAAIEAARAGEQGRGFAVVADEVRTLASRTQESTQEIQTMITALQTGAEKAVSVMDTGKKQASNCVEQSEEADKALETITHAVHEAYDRSSQIATAAGEQSTVAHEISTNLESIVAIAEQTTEGSKQTAESSNEVAKLAEELQQSVQEFKL